MAPEVDRQRAILEARKEGESIAGIARRFGVSTGTVRYWLNKGRGAQQEAQRRGPGRPPILAPEEVEQMVRLVRERPDLTLRQVLVELEAATGKRLGEGTARQYLCRLGIRRVRPEVEKGGRDTSDEKRVTRYQPRHRRKASRESYPSDLTDAEWEILQPVFAPEGQPGRPGIYDRRRILDAIFYVVRGGVAWRMLPHDFPPWDNVYAHFRRWSDKGLFEKMHDLLRVRWREREGRRAGATASIIDSQSVKTTEKGGPAGTMRARRSTDASDTSS